MFIKWMFLLLGMFPVPIIFSAASSSVVLGRHGQNNSETTKESLPKELTDLAIKHFKLGDLHLFDGSDGKQQCHMNALWLATQFQKLNCSKEQELDKNRQLMLNFVLSPIMRKHPVVQVFPFKKMEKLKGELSELINQCIKGLAIESSDEGIRHFVKSSQWNQFPKFVGIKLMIENAKKSSIPLVIKTKVLCPKGVHIQKHVCFNSCMAKPMSEISLPDSTPVIVIEGVSSIDKLNFRRFNGLRKKCPNNLFNGNDKLCHSLAEHCSLCECHQDDQCLGASATVFKVLSAEFVQLALAAEFVATQQKKEWLSAFTEGREGIVPDRIRREFLLARSIATLSMNTKDIRFFFIEHMFASIFGHAKRDKRWIDQHP